MPDSVLLYVYIYMYIRICLSNSNIKISLLRTIYALYSCNKRGTVTKNIIIILLSVWKRKLRCGVVVLLPLVRYIVSYLIFFSHCGFKKKKKKLTLVQQSVCVVRYKILRSAVMYLYRSGGGGGSLNTEFSGPLCITLDSPVLDKCLCVYYFIRFLTIFPDVLFMNYYEMRDARSVITRTQKCCIYIYSHYLRPFLDFCTHIPNSHMSTRRMYMLTVKYERFLRYYVGKPIYV